MKITNEFIIESLKFILSYNYLVIDDRTYIQLLVTAMGTKCAPPYACFTIGYLEETKFFNKELKKINKEECKLIINILRRYSEVIIWISTSSYMKIALSRQISIINRPPPMIICHILVPIQIIHNIPLNLTKRIIISVSNQEKVEIHLNELQHFLLSCKNPEHVIGRGFFNAKLQGSAPKRNVVTTYYSNIDTKTLIKKHLQISKAYVFLRY